jgi:CRISPR type III-A-associated RAMP protein Csm4
MNPGLVVKLRPSGPWRIGPDSGARNRVDVIYHSDSLYSAITAAMARLGWLEDWLDATARTDLSAVSFGSCFPYMDDIGFVVPPRTVWPPASSSARSARVRWKSARFVPLTLVQSILAGKRLEENQWSVDGPSDCLVPTGRPGPFRTAVRWSAGVDRLTGVTERHSTACLEFRPGSGLWTVVSFADETAQARWAGPVKAAFRLLADTGFGGERSRGWGRSEAPEFTEGTLPELILPAVEPEVRAATVREPSDVAPMVVQPETPAIESVPIAELGAPAAEAVAVPEIPADAVTPVPETAPEPQPEAVVPAAPPAIESVPIAELEAPAAEAVAVPEIPADAVTPVPEIAPEPEPEAVVPAEPSEPEPVAEPEAPAAAPAVTAETTSPTHPHWLLSVFTPAATDTVDWRRGNYTVLARGGRVDSPAGSGELKKQIPMVAEGSVVYAEVAPRGSAADVAPDGFAHPVFRAGFALAIPLPEVS